LSRFGNEWLHNLSPPPFRLQNQRFYLITIYFFSKMAQFALFFISL
jgi:hypothetical protein